MTVLNHIKELLSYEEYSFSIEELLKNSTKSEIAIKRELSRLVEKKEIINLRKGFYLIIPPRYSNLGQLPIQLYVDKLFSYLDRYYYVSFYSAAKFYGASHQQIQRDYIITNPPSLLDIKKKTIELRFFTTSNWPKKNIINKKSDAGYFKISTPALTAADLIHCQSRLGSLNRMLAILEELFEEIELEDLKNLTTWYPHKSTLQRFGFLLDILQADNDLVEHLFVHLTCTIFFPVLLSPDSSRKAGSVKNRWKVDVNVKLESDL